MKQKRKVASRLWKKVWKRGPREHWPWLGYIDKEGHGRIWYNGQPVPVHRIIWLLEHGEIPEGQFPITCPILKDCCNPEHIGCGTWKDVAERITYKKGYKPQPKGFRRLTPEQVRQIYLSTDPSSVLGRRYGVASQVISQIRYGKRHVTITRSLERQGNILTVEEYQARRKLK